MRLNVIQYIIIRTLRLFISTVNVDNMTQFESRLFSKPVFKVQCFRIVHNVIVQCAINLHNILLFQGYKICISFCTGRSKKDV